MAIILKLDGEDSPDKLHQVVYEETKKQVDDNRWEKLTNGSHYRQTTFTSIKSFNEQIPFYTIKPLYLFLAFLSYKLGASLAYSTVWPSLISYFLLAMLLLKWIGENIKNPWLVLWISLFIITFQPVIDLGKTSSADGVSTLLILSGFYLFIEKKLYWPAVIFFTLSILARPDNIILLTFTMIIVAIDKWEKKVNLWKVISTVIMFFIAYYVPRLFMETISLPILLHHVFISQALYPLTDPPHLSVIDYLNVLAKSSVHRVFFAKTVLLIITLFTIGTMWNKLKNADFRIQNWTFNELVALIIILTLCTRFILFPIFLDRFMVNFIIISGIIFIKEITKHRHIAKPSYP